MSSAVATASNVSAAAAAAAARSVVGEMQGGMLQMQSMHYLGDKPWLTVICSVCLSAATILGAVGNVMIILSVLIDKFLRQPGNAFLINLALGDLLVSTVLDPFNAVSAVYGGVFYSNHYSICMVVGVLCTVVCTVSLFDIMAVAINRYVRICKFKYYKRLYTWKSSVVMCAATWIAGLLIHFPNDIGWGKTGYNTDYYYCGFIVTYDYSYSLFAVCVSVVAPLVVTIFCCIKIFAKFKSSRSAVEAHNNNVTHGGGDGGSVVGGVAKSKDDDERRLLRTLGLVLIVFVVCWLPFVVLVAAGTPRWVPGWIYVFSVIMGHSNSALNVFIYGLTNRYFRACYRRLLFYVVGKFFKLTNSDTAANHVVSLNLQQQATTINNNGLHTHSDRKKDLNANCAHGVMMTVREKTTTK